MVLSQKQHSHSTAMNFYIPKVRLRKHQYPQWFTPELRHLTKCACSFKKRISHCPTNTLKENSLTWNALYETKCYLPSLHLKRISLSISLVKQNSKIYDYIRKLSNSNSMPSCAHLESSLVTSDQEKAAL